MKEVLVIKGGEKLKGTVSISGAKNAALPLIAASLLSNDDIVLSNIPRIEDVCIMLDLIREVGANISKENNTVSITPQVTDTVIRSAKAQLIRASILLAGPLVAKIGSLKLPFPGGCNIGTRKIDLHLNGLKALGAKVKVGSDFIEIKADKKLRGAKIELPFPSVGATENILMAATLAEGETVIKNASIEPEVVDLQRFLSKLGAGIEGIGTRILTIEGVEELTGTQYSILPDRIETGTYIAAVAASGGRIILKNCDINIMENIVQKFTEIGVNIKHCNKGIEVSMNGKPLPTDIITQPYPGFPTDMHPIMTSVLSLAKGRSTIKETIYDNRFQYVQELKKMGAKIEIKGDTLIINGIDKLKGTRVAATDIRGGAALVIAGLTAEGRTLIENIKQIERGYEQIDEKLRSVGAEVKRLKL